MSGAVAGIAKKIVPLFDRVLGKYRVPHNVFRLLIYFLIEGLAIISIKPSLPAFSMGRQCEALCSFKSSS